MNKTLVIAGIGLFAGAMVYVLWNKTYKIKADMTVGKKEPMDITTDNSAIIINPDKLHEETDKLSYVKASSMNAMSARHAEASEIIKDTVEDIYKRSKISKEEDYALSGISSELDKLLSEE